MSTTSHRELVSGGLAIIATMLALCGCNLSKDRDLKARRVELTDFASTTQAEVAPAPSEAVALASESAPAISPTQAAAPPNQPPSDPTPTTTSTASAQSPAAPVSPPPTPPSPPPPPGRGEQLINPGDIVVIDGVVGQVSGRPIFADDMLEPIADLLRTEAARLSPQEFQMRALEIINGRMMDVVLTELFLAEAEASLSRQQQQGLLAFIRGFQEQEIATGQGSRTQTEERLSEELGLTLEQYTERERNALLIRFLIDRKINPRVIVSWKDIQREYAKRQAEFKPPAFITLDILRLSNETQAELVSDATARLAAGESFDSVTQAVGQDNITRTDPLRIGQGGITDIEINQAWTPHLAGLGAGQTTQAIKDGNRTVWIHVAAIDQPPARSLFEVQKQLEGELRFRRETEERGRYIASLFARGIHDELNEMQRRLLAVALVRYGR